MYIIYILKSTKDGKLYVGQTQDLESRLKRHNNGLVKSTRSRIPLQVVHSEEFNTREDAVKREKELKLPSAGDFKKRFK